MKGKIRFITFIATVDAYLIAFAIGFNSRHVMIVDPSLPPVRAATANHEAVPAATKSATPEKSTEASEKASHSSQSKHEKTTKHASATQKHKKKKRK